MHPQRNGHVPLLLGQSTTAPAKTPRYNSIAETPTDDEVMHDTTTTRKNTNHKSTPTVDSKYQDMKQDTSNTGTILPNIGHHTLVEDSNSINTRINSDLVKDDINDDWRMTENEIINPSSCHILVPSFIRLFVIRRIICKYSDTIIAIRKKHDASRQIILNIDNGKVAIVEELTNVFNDNLQIKSTAFIILKRLLNYGLQKYMKKWYNEKQHSNIIEMIFNQIIIKQFEKEYTALITYTGNNFGINDHDDGHDKHDYYQNILFNSDDLMCYIFQYLQYGYKFNNDLFKCSLVNSHWLYHVWNINSIYDVDLYKLIVETLKCKENNENSVVFRTWQRLISAKSISVS